jgi:hypothetical protein
MNRWILSAAAAAVFFAAPALAQDRQEVLEALGKCSDLTDDKARLACYDALAPRVKDALATPPAAVASNQPPTEEQQKSWFGFNIENLFGNAPSQQTTPQKFGADQLPQGAPPAGETAQAPPPVLDSITAGVTEYAFTPFGKFVVFLDNGQVWRQQEGDADVAHFYKDPKDNQVTISRGFIGSYNLTINDNEKMFKVVRVK